jgi:hypothetical protein
MKGDTDFTQVISSEKLAGIVFGIPTDETLLKLKAFHVLFILSDFSPEISNTSVIFHAVPQFVIHLFWLVGALMFRLILQVSLLFAYWVPLQVDVGESRWMLTVFVSVTGAGCTAFHGQLPSQLVLVGTPSA